MYQGGSWLDPLEAPRLWHSSWLYLPYKHVACVSLWAHGWPNTYSTTAMKRVVFPPDPLAPSVKAATLGPRSYLHGVFVLLLSCCVLAAGCTATIPTTPAKRDPTPEERASIRRVGLVIERDPKPADFDVFGSEGGAFSGAAVGFLGGLMPPAWVAGGPLFATPLLAVVGAVCHSELSTIENPERRFEELITQLGLPSRLAQHVQEALVASDHPPKGIMEALPSGSPESHIRLAKTKGLDTLLELRTHVGLHSESGSIVTCPAILHTGVTATLRRTADGSVLAESSFSAWSNETPRTPLLFQQVLTDDSVLAQAVDDQLKRIAVELINWLLPQQPLL